MRNRAKCKKCQSIIESYTISDYVTCKCGEIGICGGTQALLCESKDWNSFIRVDDEDNEVLVKVVDKDTITKESVNETSSPSKKELIDMLDTMIKNIESLPPLAMSTPISHYDFVSSLLLLLSILRSE
jgi:hypothetical protein